MTRRRPKRRPPRRTGPAGFPYQDALRAIRPDVARQLARDEVAVVELLIRRARRDGRTEAEAIEYVRITFPFAVARAEEARRRIATSQEGRP